MRALLIAAACALLPAPSLAAKADDLFEAGQFAAAADAARGVETPESLALAARATLVVAAYEADTKERAMRLIGDAMADADSALALAPNHVGAMLQKAIALGYRAQLTRSPGDAKAARRLMERAYAADRRNALAAASLGGWHSGAIGNLGRFVAGTLLGAKKDEAVKYHNRAVQLAPNDPVFRTFYAIGLIDMGEEDEVGMLRSLLGPVAKGRDRSGFEGLIQQRARDIVAALGDDKKLEAVAAASQPFAQID